jgi:hypothetical protein
MDRDEMDAAREVDRPTAAEVLAVALLLARSLRTRDTHTAATIISETATTHGAARAALLLDLALTILDPHHDHDPRPTNARADSRRAGFTPRPASRP